MKPFKRIETHHLGMLLLVARVIFFIGLLFFLILILVILWFLFSSPFGASAQVLITLLSIIPFTLAFFALSGLLAAVVAFEESYRKRTEVMINSSKT